jgi:hypothetical protein
VAALASLKARYAELYARNEPRSSMKGLRPIDRARYQKRVWATRKAPWVDRLASAWLIKRFIDRGAKFVWIARPSECPKKAVGFDYDGVITWYKPSFDPEFASRSPGLVLVQHLIRYAVDQGRRELDFTLGGESFKSRFTNSARKTVRIQIFRDPVRYVIERARQRATGTVNVNPSA